jgi:iron complex outermembrane receptor protein
MGVIKHRLTTDVDGAKIKNEFSYYGHNIELGADYSKRNWDGLYYKNDVLFPETLRHSIWDVDTTTVGGYIKDSFKVGAFTWDIGARYDSIEIETPRVGDRDRSFNELSGSLMLHYALNDAWEIFVGGSSGYRVPDGKELYYRNKMGIAIGNEDLNGVRSYEADVGVKYSYGNLTFKLKGFYNYLQDNILYNSTAQTINGAVYGRYENVDSYIYGVEFNGGYRLSDKLLADFSLAWLKGKKDKPLTGQSDTDLPDLPPLRATFGVDYMPTDTLTFRAEVQTSSRWSSIDSDNGEQELAGWGILNLKLKKSFGEHFEVIAGVDNLLDQKYQVSNTYKDLTLITGGDEVMPINEPGRYTYINFRYKF